jgi:hypothetical protein
MTQLGIFQVLIEFITDLIARKLVFKFNLDFNKSEVELQF